MTEDQLIRLLRQQVASALRRNVSFPARLILAISGGLDSVCLLDILQSLAPQLNFSLGLAHYNHKMRGADSDQDEQFVRGLALARNLPLQADSWPADRPELNSENAAREARYQFLFQCRRHFRADWIVTAHHADDQAETLLLQLGRGCGLDGLSGMPAADYDRHLLRPLLGISRQELALYARARRLTYREDLSNQDWSYRRNRIRHSLLPLLRDMFDPQVTDRIAATAQLLQADQSFLQQQTDVWFEHTVSLIFGDTAQLLYVLLEVPVYQTAPVAIRRRLIRQCLGLWPAGQKDLTAADILGLDQLLMSRPQAAGSSRNLPRDLKYAVSGTACRFWLSAELSDYSGFLNDGKHTLWLTKPGAPVQAASQALEQAAFKLCRVSDAIDMQDGVRYNNSTWLVESRLLSCFYCRTRRSGDELLYWDGSAGFHKSLKKYLQEKQIWPELRDKICLIVKDQEIDFIPGLYRNRRQPGALMDVLCWQLPDKMMSSQDQER
ncbi:tRNA lysidine(34) synthetase TilS [Oscillospiraceae bacterium HV4-5-C5C]|nr:tRNA lysidine(34) synthetase TilS [Oscillospiraceae bacterium HV4-5-C5C]